MLFGFDVIDFKTDKYNNILSSNDIVTNDINNNKNNDNIVDNDESIVDDSDNSVDNDILTKESNSKISVLIADDGRVAINKNKFIDYIKNAKSIRLIDQLSPYSMLYILTYNGDVYKYNTSEYENGNYKAIKVISNIKQISLYKKEAIMILKVVVIILLVLTIIIPNIF